MKALPIQGRTVPSDLVLLSILDLMKLLGVHRSTMDKIRKRPDFPPPVMLANHRRAWRAAAIQQWLEQQTTADQAAKAANQPCAAVKE